MKTIMLLSLILAVIATASTGCPGFWDDWHRLNNKPDETGPSNPG